ncbi:Chlorovirus glycoprotein repeat domain-containing protein [Paramecium bursaria Chlorella virus CVM-1]|nr:Chlorovirus glycoprotein repeat domain-containing protein [Paramecium bursaria Chlorella virus CVM-1]
MQGSLWEMVAGSRASLLHQQQFQPPMSEVTSSGRTPMSLTLSQTSGATSAMWCSLGVMVAASGQINVLGNVVSSFMIGDNRGNIIGSYANVSNIISNVGGNIGNVVFLGGNVAASGQINVLGNVVSSFMIGDNMGNIIGSYANVSNIISNVGGNIANVRFTMDGNVTTGAYINAGFFVGDGSGLTGITSTPAAISTTDVRGNIIGSYANVSNIISNVGGNIANVVFLGGNVAASGQINVLGNVVSSFMIGDNRGNIIGSYANVSNIISNVGGNIANVVFLGGNVAASGQINVLGNVVSSFMIGDNRGNIIGSYANVSNVFANVSINVFDNVGSLSTTANLFNSVSTSAVVPNGWKHMSCVTRGNTVFQLTGDGSVASNVSSNVNLMNLYSTNVGYQSVMLQILTNRAQNPNYSFIECDNSDGATIVAPFSVNGQGNVDSTSSISVLDGTTGAIRWRAANTGTMRANVSLNTFNLMNLHSTGATFSSTIVNLQTTRTTSSAFDFIDCLTNDGDTPVFIVNGLGNVTANGALTVDTGSSYGAAPLANNINSVSTSGTSGGHGHISCVTRGNTVFRVDVGGTITSNILQNVEVANLYATSAGFTRNVLSLQTLRGNSTAFNFIRCAANDGADPTLAINGLGGIRATTAVGSGIDDIHRFTNTNNAFRGALTRMNLNGPGYTAMQFITCTNDSAGNVFRVRGDGTVYGTGAYNSSGADYAEMFEWMDGNPMSEDRRCKTVTLVDDGKIRLSEPSDDPWNIFGIVSSRPTIVGDAAWNEWSGKYIRNKFGDKTILNSEYDPNSGYISREDRKEWDPIGLVGKLRVLPDQKVNPSWRFLRTITSDDGIVHEYLLTSGVNSDVMAELNSLKSELSTIKAHLGI